MIKIYLLKILLFIIIFIHIGENGFCQEEKLICEGVPIILKYYFSEKSIDDNLGDYKAFVFTADNNIDTSILTNIGYQIYSKSAGSILKPEKVIVLGSIDDNYLIVIFKDKKFNELFYKESDININNDFKKPVSEVKSKEIYFKIFLYYAKKSIEDLDKAKSDKNIDDKLARIKNFFIKAQQYYGNSIYYELKAYRYFLDKEIYNEDSISLFYNNSLEGGNRDSVFLRNYVLWNYQISYKIYIKVDLNVSDYSKIINHLKSVIKYNTVKDTILSYSNYIDAYCKYKMYTLSENNLVINLEEVAENYKKNMPSDSTDKYFCDSKLLIGNMYFKLNFNTEAKEYYESIIKYNCSDDYVKIANKNLKKLEK